MSLGQLLPKSITLCLTQYPLVFGMSWHVLALNGYVHVTLMMQDHREVETMASQIIMCLLDSLCILRIYVI